VKTELVLVQVLVQQQRQC